MTQSNDYLITVRRDEKTHRWSVDIDSGHILEDEGGYPVLELQVHTIRALTSTLEETERDDEHDLISIARGDM